MTEKEVLDLKLSEHLLKLMLNEDIPFEKKKGKMDYLIRMGADVNAKDDQDRTLLMLASKNGYKEMVEILLEKGANIEAKDRGGETALMKASENGKKEIVEMLLKKGANPEEKDKDGWTALMLAIWYNHKEVAEVLNKEMGKRKKSKENLNKIFAVMERM